MIYFRILTPRSVKCTEILYKKDTKDGIMLKRKLDLCGQRFGKLVVLEQAEDYILKNGRHKIQWLCQCDCGNIKIAKTDNLRAGYTKSCGCLRQEVSSTANITHGMAHTRLHNVWKGMRARCYNCNSTNYQHYGGRGITMCDDWYNDYANFYLWAINNGYKSNAKRGECTIDRIDVNKGYSPDNCRFIDVRLQARNRTNNHLVRIGNETHCISEWEEILGLSRHSILKLAKET